MIDVVCEQCKETFRTYPSLVSRGKKFCSRACSGESLSERRRDVFNVGEANPMFKHGKYAGESHSKWGIYLKKGPCRRCGKPAQNLHHAIPKAHWRAGKRDLRNGLPLCASCHATWHRGVKVIYKDCFTKDEWDFLLTADIPGVVTEAWLDNNYPDRPL